jgi:phosphate transport system regulatory protein PhoU
LEDELETLKEQILLMGGKVEEAIRHSMKSLTDRDSKLAEQVILRDRKIDDLQIEVDEHCHRMLALYQPTAGDMRFITSTMKINSDLERMGDLSVNIAERAIALNEDEPLKPYIDLPRMAEISQDMVHKALDSLVSGNVVSAKKVCERDDEVDHQFHAGGQGQHHQVDGFNSCGAPLGKNSGPRHQRGGRRDLPRGRAGYKTSPGLNGCDGLADCKNMHQAWGLVECEGTARKGRPLFD